MQEEARREANTGLASCAWESLKMDTGDHQYDEH
jgi:hypothetical protein